MAGNDDLKSHALNGAHDFYDLIGAQPGASESEIRRAYRKTALKVHPDKNTGKVAVIEQFHLLQIAYDVLSDSAIRELYDNARRARQEKKDREQAFEGRRKWMKEDLERRESGAFKRKREEVDEEEAFERELKRLAQDGKRRRQEREEALRREIQAESEIPSGSNATCETSRTDGTVSEVDRSITLRFPKNNTTQHIDRDSLESAFCRFGAIEEIVLRDKKVKVEGEKHRMLYNTAVVVFRSIVGAHAAISDMPNLQREQNDIYGPFQQVAWVGGKEPEFIPKPYSTPWAKTSPQPQPRDSILRTFDSPQPSTPVRQTNDNEGGNLRRVPSFASFKNTPQGSGSPANFGTPSADDMTMIRLKNAERRRLEAKIRREEEQAAAVDGLEQS